MRIEYTITYIPNGVKISQTIEQDPIRIPVTTPGAIPISNKVLLESPGPSTSIPAPPPPPAAAGAPTPAPTPAPSPVAAADAVVTDPSPKAVLNFLRETLAETVAAKSGGGDPNAGTDSSSTGGGDDVPNAGTDSSSTGGGDPNAGTDSSSTGGGDDDTPNAGTDSSSTGGGDNTFGRPIVILGAVILGGSVGLAHQHRPDAPSE